MFTSITRVFPADVICSGPGMDESYFIIRRAGLHLEIKRGRCARDHLHVDEQERLGEAAHFERRAASRGDTGRGRSEDYRVVRLSDMASP